MVQLEFYVPHLHLLLGYIESIEVNNHNSFTQVNLPANRVIIRSPRMGRTDLSIATFRQMCGRAGRMNMDTNGQAVCANKQNSHVS